MTWLVSGANGLLGREVTALLTAAGEHPRVLILPGEKPHWKNPESVDVWEADINDPGALRRALQGVDQVVHCAARTGPWGPRSEYRRTNVAALESFVGEAMKAGVCRFVHVSSITVHGNDHRGQADEDAPFRVEPNPYSWSKVAGERLLARMISEEGARVSIVRPGWIYGPGDTANFARLAHLIEARRLAVLGSGHNRLPLIYLSDAARGTLLASKVEEAEGRVYLLVNDEAVSQQDFLSSMAAELGAPMPTRHIPYRLALLGAAQVERIWRCSGARRPPPLTRYGLQLLGGDNRFIVERARAELGFSAQTRLAEGIRQSVEWYRSTQRALGARASTKRVPA